MNIAVVDDSQLDRQALSKHIHQYMSENHLAFTLFEYARAEDFILALSSHTFSLVFLDIYLDQMTGMDAAKFLRQRDKDCKIVFLTSSTDYILEGYSVNASHYLIKPVGDQKFAEAMENCRLRPQHAVPYLDLAFAGGPVSLDTRLISHINILDRKVQIHTSSKTFSLNGSFTNITKPLQADRRFLLCLQGVMVNMDYISNYEDKDFILKSGERIPINIRNRKRILQHYHDYIFEQMNSMM